MLTSFFWNNNGRVVKLAGSWWREPDLGEDDEDGTTAAFRLWRIACNTLVAPDYERAWKMVTDTAPSNKLWHSLDNCVSHQAIVWQNLLSKGMDDVMQPAAFKLAIVLRHTKPDLTAKLLADLLKLHPQSQDLTSYVLTLLTDDEGGCGTCMNDPKLEADENMPTSPVPVRDLQLFGDCELSVLAAPQDQYDAHAKLVRQEYMKLAHDNHVELRIKVLNQLIQIPRLFHTPEFQHLEKAARDNIEREISMLREELLTAHGKKQTA